MSASSISRMALGMWCSSNGEGQVDNIPVCLAPLESIVSTSFNGLDSLQGFIVTGEVTGVAIAGGINFNGALHAHSGYNL